MDSRAEHVNMEKADNTVSGAARLAALGRYDVHTPAQAPFDDLAALAADLCDCSSAAIVFLDKDRRWIKTAFGRVQPTAGPAQLNHLTSHLPH